MIQESALKGSANAAAPRRAHSRAARQEDGLWFAARRLFADESGQGIVEYALIITFTALVCLVGLRYLGGKANNTLANAANSLS